MARDWLLITLSTPRGGTSTLRVYAWRNLRRLGAHYLQQSVCLLPATPKTTRVAARLVARLRADGDHGEMLRIHLTDSRQEAAASMRSKDQIEQILGVPEVDAAVDAVGFEARGHGHDSDMKRPRRC